jgi:nucleoside 2-deoxyribosyltransferase
MMRDFFDVKRCDVLLINLLGCEKMTTGTVMELGWAYAMQKPVVVAIEPEGNIHDTHPMVHEAIGGLRFPTLDEAIDAVAIVLGAG